MRRDDGGPAGVGRQGRSAAIGRRWSWLGLWMAGLLTALLAGCGGGEGATAAAAPGSPSGLTVAAGDDDATIRWNAVPGATSYNVYRSTTPGVQGTKVGASATTSFVDATARNGTTYYYQVTAENAAGEGPPSAPSAAATPAARVVAPEAPTGLNAVAADAQVILSWTAVAGARSYNVYRSTSAGSRGAKVGTSSTTAFIDTSAVNGTTYFYVVTAENAAGEGAASAQSPGATPAVPLTAPAAPGGVTAVAADAQVTVRWTSAAGAASYNLYRSTTPGVQGPQVGSSASLSYVDGTAVNGTAYYYVVTAVNAVGEGPASAQSAGATPTAPVTVPAAPATVNVDDGIAQVTVTWSAVTGATSYTVYRSTTQGQRGTPLGSTPAASFVDWTALDGTTYAYVVTASNGAGEGPASAAATVRPATSWTTVKMGGGGYVPGIVYHPTVPHLRYARTDVAGVYRWDQAVARWTALTDAFGRPDGTYEGAESMALDPTDPNRVYMTARMAVQYGNGRFYYSSNKGATWSYVALPFPVGSNNNGRAIGERLMVDPNSPSTLFYASRTAGLWKSTDRGLSWAQVTTLSSYVMSTADINNANGGSPVGVEFVTFDLTIPTSGFTPTGTPTQTLYVGVASDYKNLAGLTAYLYKSTDGGASWSAVAIPAAVTTAIGGNQVHVPHLARAADGIWYVPFTSGSGPGSSGPSSLYRFDGTTWTPLIASGDGRYYGGIGGLAVHGAGATTKIAFGVSGTWGDGPWVQIAMRSADGGATWQEFGRSGDTNRSLDYHDASGYWGWADDLEIDPFDPDHVSYVLGGGIVSTTEGFSAPLPHWRYDVDGLEEMINLVMTAPPPGAPYVLASGHGDTGLYVHTSLTTSANRSPSLGGGNGTGIDLAWNDPSFVVGVGTFGTSKGAYSTDAGVTWTTFPSVPPVGSAAGDESTVAVTADGANIIWAIAGQVPYYSTDRGASWTPTNLPAPAVAYHLVADRKNPLKVYAYEHGGNWWYPSNSARFYASIDGGHSFTLTPQTWGPNGFWVTGLAVNPFVEGDLWLADANNLWHSVDSGLTWTKLTAMATVGTEFTNVHGAIRVALGAPAPGSGRSATLYLVGTIDGVDAVYRSADMGASWVRIDDDDHRYGGVNGIAADTGVYGRVFLRGRGMVYND